MSFKYKNLLKSNETIKVNETNEKTALKLVGVSEL